MATNFPIALDNLSNPSGSTLMTGGGDSTLAHATQHSNINDAVEALQATVGVTNSAVTTSLQYKISQKADATHNHTVSQITATGTPSASTYLRGDGAWAAVSESGVSSFNTRTGTVTLTSADVTDALGYTPPTSGGTLGAWQSRGANVTYVASVQGLVFGHFGSNGGQVAYNGVAQMAAQGNSTFCFPVRAGDSYQIAAVGGGTADLVYFAALS